MAPIMTAAETVGKTPQQFVADIAAGPKFKLEDGTEEDHKVIDTKDPKALKNLTVWILTQ